eukprot:6174980-Pleurochrysis_carterae.AAC.3
MRKSAVLPGLSKRALRSPCFSCAAESRENTSSCGCPCERPPIVDKLYGICSPAAFRLKLLLAKHEV